MVFGRRGGSGACFLCGDRGLRDGNLDAVRVSQHHPPKNQQQKMVLSHVTLSPEVHLLCMSYSLCTGNYPPVELLHIIPLIHCPKEKEETLALLLGDFVSDSIARVDRCIFATRKDKRKDRVEISSEQVGAV